MRVNPNQIRHKGMVVHKSMPNSPFTKIMWTMISRVPGYMMVFNAHNHGICCACACNSHQSDPWSRECGLILYIVTWQNMVTKQNVVRIQQKSLLHKRAITTIHIIKFNVHSLHSRVKMHVGVHKITKRFSMQHARYKN